MRSTRWGGLVAALALATGLATAPAPARAAGLPTPGAPGGLTAPHSPDGFPATGTGPVHRLWTTASIAASTRPGMVPQGGQ